jgi:glycosyltransferase involved in cell wall biosynthesis
MKIAIDCHTLESENWAGKEQALFHILETLRQTDKDNNYFLYFHRPVFSPGYFPAAWSVHVLAYPALLWPLAVIFRLLFKERVDILFSPCTYFLPAIKIFIPTVVMLHDLASFIPGISASQQETVKLKERWLLKTALRRAAAVVAVSENTKNDAIKYFNIPAGKISVIYPGNNLPANSISDSDAAEKILAAYGLPSHFLLFVGTLEPRKNLVNIIKAYHQACSEEKISGIPLLVVGKRGWNYQNIFSTVAEFKLEKNVIFTGYLPEKVLPVLYRQASLVLYPSLYEGFGFPVLEAMSCGAPVVTSRLSSLPEVAGNAAILVDPYSVPEITAAIKKIILEPEAGKRLKALGQAQATRFSWEKFVAALQILFSTVAERSRR